MTEHSRVIAALTLTVVTKPARSIPTTAAGGNLRRFTGSKGKRPAAAARIPSALPQALRASSLGEGA